MAGDRELSETTKYWGRWAFGTLVAVLIASGGWFGTWVVGTVEESAKATQGCYEQIATMRVEIAEVKASRFSASDGLEVWREIASIKQQTATLPSKAEVRQLEERQQTILQQMSSMKLLLERIDNKM